MRDCCFFFDLSFKSYVFVTSWSFKILKSKTGTKLWLKKKRLSDIPQHHIHHVRSRSSMAFPWGTLLKSARFSLNWNFRYHTLERIRFSGRIDLGADYPTDSCHGYLFQTTKEDLNQLKDPFASKLNQFFFQSRFYASFKATVRSWSDKSARLSRFVETACYPSFLYNKP